MIRGQFILNILPCIMIIYQTVSEYFYLIINFPDSFSDSPDL